MIITSLGQVCNCPSATGRGKRRGPTNSHDVTVSGRCRACDTGRSIECTRIGTCRPCPLPDRQSFTRIRMRGTGSQRSPPRHPAEPRKCWERPSAGAPPHASWRTACTVSPVATPARRRHPEEALGAASSAPPVPAASDLHPDRGPDLD